jgi:hypothetical protein
MLMNCYLVLLLLPYHKDYYLTDSPNSMWHVNKLKNNKEKKYAQLSISI